MMTFPIAFATLLLLAIWLIFFSRLSRRGRRVAVVAVVATIGLTAATTRIRGVTGDLVPVLLLGTPEHGVELCHYHLDAPAVEAALAPLA
mgnify:CR=1 FL=1